MASNTKSKAKKRITDLSPEGAKGVAKSERNKMKVYGDVPDDRPKGRVVSPRLLNTLRGRKGKTRI